MMYPSPFFDLASTWMPQGIKSLFYWLRYYFLNNGFFNVVVSKLAEYPITNILFEAEGEEASLKWSTYFNRTLRYRLFQLEVGLDYFVYGNSFVSVRHRFIKHLSCSACRWTAAASACRSNWTFQSHEFRLRCPRCGHSGPAMVRDVQTPSATGVRLVRWNPEDITIKEHPTSGTKTYYYEIPATLKNDIALGRPSIVEEVPQIFIEAVKKNMAVILPSEEVYHVARPTVSGFDKGWGIPLLLPVLKDGFQMQVLKKAHEVILLEHMIPLRAIFPQPAAGTADPFSSIPLTLWKEQISSELARFRWDPGYIPIMPLPIGHQSLGGEGKALLLDQQITAKAEEIVVQIGVPKEIIFGGASWSGSNVSMRSVENFFLGYLIEQEGLLHFIMDKISTVLDWPKAQARFAPFRMAEDMQRKQLLLQVKQMQAPLSWTTLFNEFNLNAKDESKMMAREAKEQTEAQRVVQKGLTLMQNEMAALQAKGQAEAQQEQMAMAQGPAPGEPGAAQNAQDSQGMQAPPQDAAQAQQAQAATTAPSGSELFSAAVESKLTAGHAGTRGMPPMQMAQVIAQMMQGMSPAEQKVALEELKKQSPELYSLVLQVLSQAAQAPAPDAPPQPAAKAPKTPGVDMRPMPEQRPPRRAQLGG